MAAEENISKGTVIREMERQRKKTCGVSEGRLHWKKDAELNELEKEYKRLKKQKQELMEKAQEASLLNEIQEYIKKYNHYQGEKEISLGKLADEKMLFKAIELTKKKKLMETYNAYRLTGVAFVVLNENCLRFCLDTFYKGQYFEPYYIEIEIKEENIKTLKHTIPFFIPLEEIFQKYKGSEHVKEFVSEISSYLNAFVSRRQQSLQAQEVNEIYVIRDFYSTPAFDFVKFVLKFSSNENSDFLVKIKYTDLRGKLPTEVDLKLAGNNDDEEVLNGLQENLLSTEMKSAIMAVNSI